MKREWLVSELIEELKIMPQELKIKLQILDCQGNIKQANEFCIWPEPEALYLIGKK